MSGMSIGRPRFVSVEEAVAWHEIAIAQYGGSLGIRDRGLLESAMAQPQQGLGGEYVHAFPFGMAAAYAFHIAKNHPFVDGNKRVSLMCCGGFLRMNGWSLIAEDLAAADAIIALVDGTLARERFADWLRQHCRERPSMELRDLLRALQPGDHFQHLTAVKLGPRGEYDATLAEAQEAIPLLEHLVNRMTDMARAGKTAESNLFAGHALMLIAIYRVAEDMGYEW